jgi:hypothetical protein
VWRRSRDDVVDDVRALGDECGLVACTGDRSIRHVDHASEHSWFVDGDHAADLGARHAVGRARSGLGGARS